MQAGAYLSPEALSVFETVPDLYLVLSPDLIILTASDAYLKATLTARSTIRGKYVFDAFPDNPQLPNPSGVANLKHSLQQVLLHRKPHQMALQRYDVPQSSQAGAGFEEKYWEPLNTPVLDTDGNVLYIIHKVRDVTELVKNQNRIEELTSHAEALTTVIEHAQQVEKDLKEEHQQLKQAQAIGHVGSFERDFENDKVYWSDELYRIFGLEPQREEMTVDKFFDFVHPDDEPSLKEALETFYKHPDRFEHAYRIIWRNGTERMLNVQAEPVHNEQGKVTKVYAIVQDITAIKQVEMELQQNTRRLQILLDAIPQMTWTHLPDIQVNFYNQRWHEYTGLDYERSRAYGWQTVVHPEDLGRTMDLLVAAAQTGESVEFENRYKRGSDGMYRWHLNRVIPLPDAAGEVTLWVGTATDIDEQKLAETARRKQHYGRAKVRLSALFDQTAVGIALIDPAGHFTQVNERYCEIVGYSAEQLQSLTLPDLVHPDDRNHTQDLFAGLLQSGKWYVEEKRVVREDGRICWSQNYLSLIRDEQGQPVQVMDVSQDITDRKRNEAQLLALARKLALTNQELAAANEKIKANNEELTDANEQLTRINADLDNFIYTASHDLKAPILNIEGLIRILTQKMNKKGWQDEYAQEIVTMILSSITRFKETIADLTEVARIQKQAEQEAEPVDLSGIVHDLVLDLQNQIEESGAQLEIDLAECTSVLFPRKNLKSIIYNLLSNAVKYRSPDRQLLVYISCYEQDPYQVLTVQDNGLGMDATSESKIFGMFKRLHTHVEGTGIRLYIVKKMIENAGGRITVESQIGKGSTFRVYFNQR